MGAYTIVAVSPVHKNALVKLDVEDSPERYNTAQVKPYAVETAVRMIASTDIQESS